MKIAVSLGDPSGIGPEIILKAIPRFPHHQSVNIFANHHILKRTAHDLHLVREYKKLCKNIVECVKLTDFRYGRPDRSTGRAALQSIDAALSSGASIIITPPIVKDVIKKSLPDFIGHTEYFAAHFRVKQYAMTGIWRRKIIMLLTTHMPVRRVPHHITPQRIAGKIVFLNACLKKYFAVPCPRIAVSAFNPHAFEFSCGEDEKIAQAVDGAQKQGIDVHGPYPADTLFDRTYDGFLTMYHDQAMVYLKSKKNGLNFTAGLPVVRLSPLYGAALDIAGTNRAEFTGLLNALNTGRRLLNNARKYEKNIS